MRDDHRYRTEDGRQLPAYQLPTTELLDLLADGLQVEGPEDGNPEDGMERLRIELVARSLGLTTGP